MNREENESLLEYKLRLSRNKAEYNLSWTDIANLYNKEADTDYSESTFRKWYSAFHDGYVYRATENQPSDIIETIEEKTRNLELERKKRQVASLEYNKLLREDARQQLFFETVKESIQKVEAPVFYPLLYHQYPVDAVLGISDMHFGKIINFNGHEYNESIFHRRMNDLMQDTVRIIHKEKLDHIHIVNAGDSVEGMALRISQLQHLEMGFIDMVIRFSRYMVEWLNELSRYVQITYHHVQSANHTELRPLGTKAGQFPKEDMERIILMYIHDMLLNNSRINVIEYDCEYVKFTVQDFLIYAVHGHNSRNIENYLRDLSMLHREFIDLLILGHYHHSREIAVNEGLYGNSQVLLLPSIMGSDDFSYQLGRSAAPGAKLFLIEKEKGKTVTYDLLLR